MQFLRLFLDVFRTSLFIEKQQNNMTGDGKNEKNYGCVGSSGYGEFSSE